MDSDVLRSPVAFPRGGKVNSSLYRDHLHLTVNSSSKLWSSLNHHIRRIRKELRIPTGNCYEPLMRYVVGKLIKKQLDVSEGHVCPRPDLEK